MVYELQVWELGFGWRHELTSTWKEITDEAEKFIARGYRIRIESREKDKWE